MTLCQNTCCANVRLSVPMPRTQSWTGSTAVCNPHMLTKKEKLETGASLETHRSAAFLYSAENNRDMSQTR